MRKIEYPGGEVSINQIASLDVDAQKGFTPICPGELPVSEGDQITDELNMQAKFAEYRVFTKDVHPPGAYWEATSEQPQYSEVEGYPSGIDISWNAHCVSGTEGSELIDGLPDEGDYDYWVTKGTDPKFHPYGACYQDLEKRISTGLIEWLRVKGVTAVIVGGLATDYCVKETVLELLDADLIVILNLGACRGISSETTEQAIKEMAMHPACIIVENAVELEGFARSALG